MKNLLIFLLLFPALSFSQQKREPAWMKNSPGQEFKLASRHFYIGFGMSVGGSLFLYSGLSQNQKSGIIAGSAMSLIGVIFMLESHAHISRAGEIMDSRKIGFAQNGIGITYRF